jgi:pyruvate dehydrogenase E1 component beta subunit
VPEGEYLVPIGVGDIKRPGSDVTIIAWSKMIHVALDAAKKLSEEGIDVEIIDPRTLRPLDEQIITTSIEKTNRCVIIEEGWRYAGIGAEIVDRINLNAFDSLDAPVLRVTSEDVPMPYAKNMERAVLPSVEKVIAAVKKVMYV